MRKVETKSAGCACSRERGLSMLPVRKLQVSGILIKVSAQQFTKQSARHHKSVSVVHKVESIRPALFIQGKRLLKLADGFAFTVQRRVPHVDLVPDLRPFR